MLLARMPGDAGCWGGMSFSAASRIFLCAVKRQRASSPPNSGLLPAPPPKLAFGQAAGSVCTPPAAEAGTLRESQLWLLALDRRPADALGPSRALIASIRPEKATRPRLAGMAPGFGPASNSHFQFCSRHKLSEGDKRVRTKHPGQHLYLLMISATADLLQGYMAPQAAISGTSQSQGKVGSSALLPSSAGQHCQ